MLQLLDPAFQLRKLSEDHIGSLVVADVKSGRTLNNLTRGYDTGTDTLLGSDLDLIRDCDMSNDSNLATDHTIASNLG